MRRAAAVATLALAAGAGEARAAYDPQLDVRVDPATPGAPAALTATVRQAPGEAATQSERVRFPAQFTFNPELRVTRCSADEERASACPDASRIGTAEAQTAFGDFAGPVHLTTDFRFVVFLRGFAGLVQQKVSGHLLLAPDGSVDSVLENLPDVSATLARVAFEAGPRSLFLTPRKCGDYDLDAQFVSHDGDRVARRATVRIAGCDSAPRIEDARVRRTGRRARVTWRLSDAGAATLLDVERRVRSGRFVRWRRVRRLRAPAAPGLNRISVPLSRAGRHQIVLTTLSTSGRQVDVSRVPVGRAG